MIITKNSLIVDILKTIPSSIEVFEKHNMGCFSCMGVQKETLEKGCLMHGIDVDELIKELEQLKG